MIIGTHDTDKWGVVASYSITPPEVVMKYIEIPGRNGRIDASEALTGYPTYLDRELKVQLLIVEKTPEEFQKIYDEIYEALHGRRLNASVTYDAEYHYTGRWAVASINHETRNVRTIDLVCQCAPYAFKNAETEKSLSVGDVTLTSSMPTQVTLTITKALTMKRNGTTYTYAIGTHYLYPLLVGSETWTITAGAGIATYQEGKL